MVPIIVNALTHEGRKLKVLNGGFYIRPYFPSLAPELPMAIPGGDLALFRVKPEAQSYR